MSDRPPERARERAEALLLLIVNDPASAGVFYATAESQQEIDGAILALLADKARREKTLGWIADPSYVGNYKPQEVLDIYRRWAQDTLDALSADATTEEHDGE